MNTINWVENHDVVSYQDAPVTNHQKADPPLRRVLKSRRGAVGGVFNHLKTLQNNTRVLFVGKMPPRAATISDISKASGMSRWVVSAVLFPSEKNKHTGYSEVTKKRVLAAAKRLRYRPNRASRNLMMKKHGVIGILTCNLFNIPWHSIHATLMAAQRLGQVISFEAFQPDSVETPLFIRESVVDGLIMFEPVPSAIDQALEYHNIPSVYVNACRHKPNSINMDEAGAMDIAVRHLASRGKKRLALIVGDDCAPFELERKTAFQSMCKRFKIRESQLLVLPNYVGGDLILEDRLLNFLAQKSSCDALITPHGGFAGMAYKVCARLRRKIPEDLAIICMQNPDMLLNLDPPVTAFALQERQFGELAVEMLNHLIVQKKQIAEIVLPYEFIIRPSS